MSDLVPILAQVSSNRPGFDPVGVLIAGIVVFIVVSLFSVPLVWVIAEAWTQIRKLQLEVGLKRQMIDRGMSAEDIVSVLQNRRPGERAEELPCASEALVEIDDEWQTALVLKHEGDRYYLHVVGTDMSDNQWVTSDRVRFAARGHDGCARPMDWSFLGSAFGAGNWCGRAGRSKPEPVDQEV